MFNRIIGNCLAAKVIVKSLWNVCKCPACKAGIKRNGHLCGPHELAVKLRFKKIANKYPWDKK